MTETQYENPKFVEDVIRDATLVLRDFPGIRGFSLEVEAFESIHDHNAWAAWEDAPTTGTYDMTASWTSSLGQAAVAIEVEAA